MVTRRNIDKGEGLDMILNKHQISQLNNFAKPTAKDFCGKTCIPYRYGMIIKAVKGWNGRLALWQTRQGKGQNGFICWID